MTGPLEKEYKALYPAITDEQWFKPTKQELLRGREFFFEQLLKTHKNITPSKPESESIISNQNMIIHMFFPFAIMLAIYIIASVFFSISH